MESPSFLYYAPDSNSQTRQHGQFLSQPPSGLSPRQQPLSLCEPDSSSPSMPYPSALVYPRPSSSHAPTIHAPTPILANATLSPDSLQKSSGLLTPSSPTILTMDGHCNGEVYFFPPTPTLSSDDGQSPVGTVLTTPISQSWALDEGCNGTMTPVELQLPSTPGGWKERSPVSPVYNVPLNLVQNHPSPTLMLSACPSLSPSSDHSSSPSEFDFCDPRQLTYPSPNSSFSEHDFDLRKTSCDLDSPIHIKIEDREYDLGVTLGDDITCGFVDQLPQATINPADLLGAGKRAREDDDEEETWPFDDYSDDESVLGESSGNSMLMPPSPPASDFSRRNSVDPTYHRQNKKVKAEHDSDAELDDLHIEARLSGYPEDACDGDYLSPYGHHNHSITPAPTEGSCDSYDRDSPEITPAPIVRRGRKQSLTEDPSKTFVCHLCTRRFRRQEHLKRHFRSLHTKDKPFSCDECGKKFSRSDNLSQHARTHGSATIHMQLVDGEMLSEDGLDNSPLGIVLVDAAQASSGIKDKLSSASEAKKNRRKRKRDE